MEVGDLASLLFLIDHMPLDCNAKPQAKKNLRVRERQRKVYPWAFSFDPDKFYLHHHHYYFCVGNHEDCKMQLTSELSYLKCYHILDNLTLEAVKDVKIQELHRFVDDVSSDELKAKDAKAMLYDFANGIIDGLYVLFDFKGDAVLPSLSLFPFSS
ncbi:hypothetical protein CsSME_00043951 [Camellia sinensis var. sinensis]